MEFIIANIDSGIGILKLKPGYKYKKMPELKYGKVVKYMDITDMEGYYENSEDKQNRESD